MASIPEFSRTIAPDRTTSAAAQMQVARAPHEQAAALWEKAGNFATNVYQMEVKDRMAVAAADNATWVNAQSVAYRKEMYDTVDRMRKDRMSSPANFHQDFDAEMESIAQGYLGGAPTDAGARALQEQMADMRTGFYDNNIQWENQRSLSIFGERMDATAENMRGIAYRAGTNGEPLDSTKLMHDVEASVVTGSSFVAPEKLQDIRKTMRRGIMTDYINGLADARPVDALKVLEQPDVAKIYDPKEYQGMKEALENRSLRVQEITAKKEVLGVLRDENNLLTRSLANPVSYGELEKAFSAQPGMSAAAKEYFRKANGFTGTGGEKHLTPEQKAIESAAIYSDVAKMTEGQDEWAATRFVKGHDKIDITPEMIRTAQDRIYTAMNNKVLSDDEGMLLLSQVLQPYADQVEAGLEKYSQNSLISSNTGLSAVEDMFNDRVKIPVPDDPGEDYGPGKRAGYSRAVATNAANKVLLYQNYLTALGEQAKSLDISMDAIPQLNKTQRRALFTAAQDQAWKMYVQDTVPGLAGLRDMPNQILVDGKMIPGAPGPRDLKPDFTAKGNFIILEKGGHRARKYSDGTIEVIQ